MLGLKEYWYPAIRDSRVGWRKPVFLKLLGEDLCLFRGKSGNVTALTNVCPHRGAMLAQGTCEFRGHVTCFYHGFVFNERGECVAALGEGPQSPMPGKVHARVYPTRTLKGVVFLWMGEGKPAPIEETLPEEFFQSDKIVFNWQTQWASNWRPALENGFDSHFRYLHRNALLTQSQRFGPPSFPRERFRMIGQSHLRPPPFKSGRTDPEFYPVLGQKWPRRDYRWAWVWLFAPLRRLFLRLPTYRASEEWDTGMHLPGMVRINQRTHMWTRWAMPVEVNLTRLFYFHVAHRPTRLGRIYEWCAYHFFHHWVMDRNLSGQDEAVAVYAYHDRPENLAPTDGEVVGLRRMLSSARGQSESR